MTLVPVAPKRIRTRLHEIATRPYPIEFGAGKRGVIVNLMEQAVMQLDPISSESRAKDNRLKVLGWLFTPDDQSFKRMSTHDLTPQQMNALWQWIDPDKDGDNVWKAQDNFQTEMIWILDNANVAEIAVSGQMKLPMSKMTGIEEIKLPDGVAPGDVVAEALELQGAVLAGIEEGEITW